MQVSNYGIEEIPDTARLYYRVHKNIYMATVKAAGIPQGKLPSGVFRFQGGDLSVDWSKYAKPDETKNRAKVPEDNGIVDFIFSHSGQYPAACGVDCQVVPANTPLLAAG